MNSSPIKSLILKVLESQFLYLGNVFLFLIEHQYNYKYILVVQKIFTMLDIIFKSELVKELKRVQFRVVAHPENSRLNIYLRVKILATG